MTKWYHRLAENFLAPLGYAKAGDADRGVMAPVFAGESGGRRNSLLGSGSSGHNEALERVALRKSWVFSNIDLLAKLGSSSQLEVWREARDGERAFPITGHAFERIMRKPNPYMGNAYLKMYTQLWLHLRGEAYWMLVPDQTGELKEIWPLPSNKIEPIPDPNNFISGYLYNTGGMGNKPVVIPPENVCYFRMPNPYNYHRGLSKLSAYSDSLVIDDKSVRWNLDTFNNDANLRTIISVPSTVNKTTFSQIKAELISELVTKGKRYMITRGGDIKAESIGLSQKDMEFLDGRAFTRDEIDRVFGIPSGFWDKSANKANAGVAKAIVIEFAVVPTLILMAEDIETQILAKWYDDGDSLQARYSSILKENEELELKKNKLNWEALTVNEVRSEMGLKPVETAYGDVPWPLRKTKEALMLTGLFDAELEPVQEPEIDEVIEAFDPDTGIEVLETKSIPYTYVPWRQLMKTKPIQSELKKWRGVVKRNKRVSRSRVWHSDIIPTHNRDMIQLATIMAGDAKSVFDNIDHLQMMAKAELFRLGSDDIDEILERYQVEFEGLISQGVNGEIDTDALESRISDITEESLRNAYVSGIGDRELTEEDDSIIAESVAIVAASALLLASGIGDGLYSGSSDENILSGNQEEADRTFEQIAARSVLWLGFIASLFSRGQTKNGDLIKLMWLRGATIDGCSTCVGFDGVTKTVEEWGQGSAYPQARNGSLACGGWNCRCFFMAVDE